MTTRRATDGFLLAALLCVTLRAVRWDVADLTPQLADFLILGFLLAFLANSGTSLRHRPHPAVAIVLLSAGVLACTYLAGAAAIETRTGAVQLAKGLGYFTLHFAFLAAGVAHLIARSARFYRLALACLLGGIVASAGYAVLQLAAARSGVSLDSAVLTPVTGRPARSLSYEIAHGPDVLRARGLTLDPNHLGAMLLIPILMLAAFSTLRKRPRWAYARVGLLAALILVLLTTLSRSALAGLVAGAVFLAVRYRRRLIRAMLAPLAAVTAVLALVVATNGDFYERVVTSRATIYSEGKVRHLYVYELVGPALAEHPFFGAGLNTFALTHAPRVGGRVEASLSFYVQSLVETGILGTAVVLLLIVYVLLQLHQLHRIARLDGATDALRVEALASGLSAAVVATLFANVGYQTMRFSYFYALLMLALAASARGLPALRARAPVAGASA